MGEIMFAKSSGQYNALSLQRTRYASRGQALILAVLVMFLLVALTGLFIAMINHAMVQVARVEERQKLDGIALAGLHYVRTQLQQSIDGADWRPGDGPDTRNPGWIYQGGGFYKVSVRYGPKTDPDAAALAGFLSVPSERYLRIDVEARYALDNPPQLDADDPQAEIYRRAFLQGKRFLVRRLTAFQPIGLTDYGLWITNKDQSPEPIVLGANLALSEMEIDGYSSATVGGEQFYPIYDGPLYVNGNLTAGNVLFALTNSENPVVDYTAYKNRFAINRADQITITGKFSALSGLQDPLRVLIGAKSNASISGALTLASLQSNRALVQIAENNPLLRAIEAPNLDPADRASGVDRYRALTLGSGRWDDALGQHTGMLGQGEGLYIYNPEHYQYNGDQDALMKNWLDPQSLQWTNGVYHPQRTDLLDAVAGKAAAIELILHDWGVADDAGVVTQLPYIELRRYDGLPFVDKDNQPLSDFNREGYYYTFVEYPRNGVIFAEGNLVVKSAMPDGLLEATGGLPASLAMESVGGAISPLMNGADQLPGGWASADEIRYYVNRFNRRYDLTVVSAGTIYIEGNLLGPASRRASYRQGTSNAPIISGSVYDSKLALLARDNVVLNPTRMFEVKAREPEDLGSERAWRVTHDQALTLQFATASEPEKVQLLLRHAGDGAQVYTPDQEYAIMRLMLNNVAFRWSPGNLDAEKFYFCSDLFRQTYFPSVDVNRQWSEAMFPGLFSVKKVDPLLSGQDANFQVYGDGMRNTVQILLDGASKAHYLLSAGKETLGPGFVVRGMNMQVDALVYAQRGHWFVIPGRFQNTDATPLPAGTDDAYPRYHEPYDVKIVVNGAIVQNRPAPQYAEEASLRHWRGPNASYTGGSYDTLSAFDTDKWRWVDRRAGIEYHYDATLLRPVCYRKLGVDDYDYQPRLPKLPVSPTTFTFGAMKQI